MVENRYLLSKIQEDLFSQNRMIFIGGPRQVGKTTLAKIVAEQYPGYDYLNWDNPIDRKRILSLQFKAETPLLIFDEIHKYDRWKNFIKGIFDKHKQDFRILVTGSARLDVYRRGGDSMMGRYYHYRLHPFSYSEALGHKPIINLLGQLNFLEDKGIQPDLLELLMTFGGFPEPFLSKNEKVLKRFHIDRTERLVKEDIRDIEPIRHLSLLQILVSLLPERVGSLLSINAMREDLEVAHKTVVSWMDILEKFYYHFRISPFHEKAIKSLRKEPKMYLWDWSEVPDSGARFENLVASHLLKFVHFLEDSEGEKAELFFLRDTSGREVDFLVTVNSVPWFAVEVKEKSSRVATPLKYFDKKMKIPFVFQVVREDGVDFMQNHIRVMSASKFLTGLV